MSTIYILPFLYIYRLEDPCYPDLCLPPYSFHHVVSLTDNNNIFAVSHGNYSTAWCIYMSGGYNIIVDCAYIQYNVCHILSVAQFNNTQNAAVAPRPSTTHPLVWAEQHKHTSVYNLPVPGLPPGPI